MSHHYRPLFPLTAGEVCWVSFGPVLQLGVGIYGLSKLLTNPALDGIAQVTAVFLWTLTTLLVAPVFGLVILSTIETERIFGVG